MRNPIVIVILCITFSILWLIRKDLFESEGPSSRPPPKDVELVEVRLRSFQSQHHRVIDLTGNRIVGDANDTRMDLEPVRGTVSEKNKTVLHLTAAHGHKEATRDGDKVEFSGNVHAVTDEGRELDSQKMLYFPRSGHMESPGPATMLTTDTKLIADRFETSTQLKTGLVSGHVVIVSTRFIREPRTRRIPYLDAPPWDADSKPASAATTDPVVMTSDSGTFDMTHSLYELRVNAKARRGDQLLSSDRILYQHRRRFMQASGNARLSEPRSVLDAGIIEYDINREWVTSRQHPRALVHSLGRAGETTVSAETISIDRKRERVLADVSVHTHVAQKGKVPYDIYSNNLEGFYREERDLFRGAVRIRSTEMGADGDRAVFYEKLDKIHIIGHAKAWQLDRDGKPGRTVEGYHIIHDTKTGRSVALQNVTVKERRDQPEAAPASIAPKPRASTAPGRKASPKPAKKKSLRLRN